MRKAVLAMLAAGAAVLAPGAASADNGVSVRAIYDAGRCIVDRDRSAAVGLMQSLPLDGDVADLSVLSPEVARRCTRDMEAVSVLHLRGGIAQALFFRDFDGFGTQPSRFTRLAAFELPLERSPGGDPTADLYRWADCLVRNDSVNAERLLGAPVGSRTEGAAIERMRNYMAACAPAGAELRVRPAELRSVLAQQAYHSMYRYWSGRLSSVDR